MEYAQVLADRGFLPGDYVRRLRGRRGVPSIDRDPAPGSPDQFSGRCHPTLPPAHTSSLTIYSLETRMLPHLC